MKNFWGTALAAGVLALSAAGAWAGESDRPYVAAVDAMTR